MRTALLLVIALLLAGCGQPADPGSDGPPVTGTDDSTATPTPSPSSSTPPNQPTPSGSVALIDKAPQWLDCTERLIAVDVPDDGLSDALPDGLTAKGLAPGYWTAWTHIFACDAFVIDNATVIQDANLIVFTADVVASAALERPRAFHEYLLGAWADDPRLVDAYQHSGFPMLGPTDVAFEQSPTGTSVSFAVDGATPWSFTSPTGAATHNPAGPGAVRMFFSDESTLRWMDLDFDDVEAYMIEDQGVVEYTGEPWSLYTDPDDAMVPGASYGADTAGTIGATFGA